MDCQVIEYVKSLLSTVNIFRKDGDLCDIDIRVSDSIFSAHKVILCAASSYFRAMFFSGMTETYEKVIELRELSSKTFEILLDFVYTGVTNITSSNVQDVLAAAKMLQLSEVVEQCCDFLLNQLSPANAVGILMFAKQYSCDNLHKAVVKYIQRNFMEISQSEEFLLMDKCTLLTLIKSNELSINHEQDVFDAVLKWISYEVTLRCNNHIGREVLQHIKLPLINPVYVTEYLTRLSCSNTIKDGFRNMYFELLEYQRQQKDNVWLTQPRMYAKKYFYIIGGCSWKPYTGWTEVYTVSNIEQYLVSLPDNNLQYVDHMLCPMAFARNAFGIAVLNGLIYVIGGEKDSLIYDSVECFDPVLNKWQTVSPMLSPRSALGACVINQEIFVAGGWVGSEIATTIEKYNVDEDCWTMVGNMANPSYDAGVCEVNGKMYIIGGTDVFGEYLKTGYCFDPIREKWTEIASMHHGRSCHCLVGLNGFIYAIGGYNDDVDELTAVEKYNVERDIWSDDVPPLPKACISACASHYGHIIFVFGGRKSKYIQDGITDNIVCLDTTKNKWCSAGKLQTKRIAGGAAIL